MIFHEPNTTLLPDAYMRFNGTNDQIVNSAFFGGTPMTMQSSTVFSISLWFRATALPAAGSYTALMSNYKYNGANSNGWTFVIDSSGYAVFSLGNTVFSQQYVRSSAAISTGVWYHVIVSYDGTNAALTSLRMHLNGVDVTTSLATTITGSISYSSTNFRIGAQNQNTTDAGGQSYFWYGDMFQIQMYNRKIPAYEAKQIYDSQAVYSFLLTGESQPGLCYSLTDIENFFGFAAVLPGDNISWKSPNGSPSLMLLSGSLSNSSILKGGPTNG